jgi:predicted acyl esterase
MFAWSPVRAEPPAPGGDIPPKFVAPTEANDFVKREVMIPMRDGAHLFTVLVIPKGRAWRTISYVGSSTLPSGTLTRPLSLAIPCRPRRPFFD